MKYRTRIYYTDEQKSLMWDQWQRGESLHAIARCFDRYHSSVAGILSRTGGIRLIRIWCFGRNGSLFNDTSPGPQHLGPVKLTLTGAESGHLLSQCLR